ncbi:hypothetical protein [Streptomyces sp. 769]|uniref:hypothetical protein n=1 Tax=Streptomyces sp. 769 TaxID=1262452 RepID=UPI000A82770A|nr:hypothetical protein [Streptomyces sp. 769]
MLHQALFPPAVTAVRRHIAQTTTSRTRAAAVVARRSPLARRTLHGLTHDITHWPHR